MCLHKGGNGVILVIGGNPQRALGHFCGIGFGNQITAITIVYNIILAVQYRAGGVGTEVSQIQVCAGLWFTQGNSPVEQTICGGVNGIRGGIVGYAALLGIGQRKQLGQRPCGGIQAAQGRHDNLCAAVRGFLIPVAHQQRAGLIGTNG